MRRPSIIRGGAVVNVILEKSPEHSFQGEVNADYRNRYFNGGGIDANFRLAMSKITFDLMYGAENVKNLEYIDLYSEHSFGGRIYDIQQNERLSSKFWNHNLGALMTYNVDAKIVLMLPIPEIIFPVNTMKAVLPETTRPELSINTSIPVCIMFRCIIIRDLGLKSVETIRIIFQITIKI